MGLIRAGLSAISSTMKDQWKEYFYCESMDDDVLVVKGTKQLMVYSLATEEVTTSSQMVRELL